MFDDQGSNVYALLENKFGLKILAAEGVRAPGVVVIYAPDGKNMVGEFKKAGLQVAAGVPLQLGEEIGTTFRIGLFGLDKLYGGDDTLGHLEKALKAIMAKKTEL